MNNILITPRKYVQGPGALKELGTLVSIIGKKPLLLWDKTVKGIIGQTVIDSLNAAKIEFVDVDFQGDCTRGEVDRIVGIIKESGADILLFDNRE